jgi:hypothetical protein
MSFDFRMSDNAANSSAGGCCGSAADGLGIGLFNTATYGSAGGNNPGGLWETPSFSDAFTVGLDIFSNVDIVNLNWSGLQFASTTVGSFMDLNNNLFHRAIVTITANGANALVNMDIVEDVFGSNTTHSVFSNQGATGLDLANFPNYRVIAGGRTGGAFANGDMDNISVSSVTVPEPSILAVFGLGLLGLSFARRK